jgi:hypothetical protein
MPPLPTRHEPPAAPSLWQDLSDGSAGWGVRLGVNFAVAAALGGLVPILAYFFTALNPGWNRYSSYGIYPRDELLGFLAAMAAGGFLAATAWLWSRRNHRRAIFTPVVLTIALAAVTVGLGILVEEKLRGDQELVIGGLVCLAGAGAVLIWVQAFRRRGPKWRALNNQQDGLPDVRCPACDYRMVGLTESRCPECGAAYTLDELIAKQGFGPAGARAPQVHAPVEQPTLRSA